MTHEKMPEALRLAEMLLSGAAMVPEIDLPESAAELRRQHDEIERLRAELIKESARTAEEKLRADQMTKQHAMQAKMHAEAARKLAALQSTKVQP